ncbi:alpha-amylase family glycosyl hydrolase [Filibacter tadaridae]|uniref:Cyclomaltodextrinase n=1 Tax=Filibacter tadaridae TaxID=2483811 RepID=A0A3P5XG57_9BACL|nr:alpha-amylase family glycosyl hydrolase [Filibacter tadaridae]VDC27536.1 Cyclomaltodextrinase [Filibacter tadaridae]
MKVNKGFGLIATLLLLVSLLSPISASAKTDRTIADESIYDLLVDRYNNGDGTNDIDVDSQDLHAFNGGDFKGIVDRLDHITDLGFTLLSIGSVFETESYDGSKVLDYAKLEPHFGTDKDFSKMLKAVHKADISVIADFPLAGVSANHVWAKEGKFKTIPASEGTIDWDLTDKDVQDALKKAVITFIEKYDLDGIRLTKIDAADTTFLNEMIAAIKKAKPDAYVITNVESDADFDAAVNAEKMNALKQSYVKSDADTSPLSQFKVEKEPQFLQFDKLTGPRFTYDIVKERMFPPTRWKLATAALFTLPGIPVVPYGTEIAVNGKEAPKSHPLVNFKTDMELKDFIGDLNTLRNKSETLRKGDFEMLHNKDGFTVFKRQSDEETWIVAINNTTHTENLAISNELLGDNKRLRAVLSDDFIRQTKDDLYHVVLDREVAEIYIVVDDVGYNTPYLIATILVVVFFLGFIFIVRRKGRNQTSEENS